MLPSPIERPRVQDNPELARFRLTVEVRSAPAPARRPLRRPTRPSRTSGLLRRIPSIALPMGWLQRIGLAAAVLLVASGAWDYVQPLPAAAATLTGPPQYAVPGSPPNLPWPDV